MKMSDFTFSKGTQINADDLLSKPMTITITEVVLTKDAQQPVALRFDGDKGKPFLPCLTMRKLIDAVWEGADFSDYKGRKITIYRDPNVSFGKDEVGGVRISHMSGIDRTLTLMLLEKKGKRKKYTIFPLVESAKTEQPAEPALTLNTATLDAEIEAAKAMEAEDKAAWWKTKTKPERDYITAKSKAA